jgi:hypothetical protein
MKKLILLLILVPASAFAKVGETAAQMMAQYGKPIVDNSAQKYPCRAYESNGWLIIAHFDSNNVCQLVQYIKPNGVPWTPEEIDRFDADNIPPGAKGQWHFYDDPAFPNTQVWAAATQTCIFFVMTAIDYGEKTFFTRGYSSVDGLKLDKRLAKLSDD